MKETIKEKEDLIKEKEKDEIVKKQMASNDMKKANKEIEELTIDLNLERVKKNKAEEKLKIERVDLVELKKKITSFERESVEKNKDITAIKESAASNKIKLVREKEDIIKQLKHSEQLVVDLSNITQEKIAKSNEEVDESKRTEADVINKLDHVRSRISELETQNENEMAAAIREINKLKSEKNNDERNFEIMKNASINLTI